MRYVYIILLSILFILHTENIYASKIYVGNNNGEINIIDSVTKNVNNINIATGCGNIKDIQISFDKQTAYILTTRCQSIFVMDINTNKILPTIALDENPEKMIISPDNKIIYYIALKSTSGIIAMVNTTTRKNIIKMTIGSIPHDIALSPDGSLFFIASTYNQNGIFYIFNTTTNTFSGALPIGNPKFIKPSNRKIYVVNEEKNTFKITIVDTLANFIAGYITLPNSLDFFRTSSVNNNIYAASPDAIYMINTENNILTKTNPLHFSIIDMILSDDSKWLYTINKNNTLNVIATDTFSTKTILLKYPGNRLTADKDFVYVTHLENHAVSMIDINKNITTIISVDGNPDIVKII